MVIVLYMSSTSGNKEIKKKQDWIKNLLDGKKFEYEEIDITDPTNEEKKKFMRENAAAKEGANVPLPPQVFNGDNYCGDYDGMLEANECEELNEFLQLSSEKTDADGAE